MRSPNDLNPSDRRFLWNWTALVVAAHGVILLLLVGLLIRSPEWISQAVQAEFVGNPPPVIQPTIIARPDRQGRSDRKG